MISRPAFLSVTNANEPVKRNSARADVCQHFGGIRPIPERSAPTLIVFAIRRAEID
jgi:hypothetical protein